MATIGERIDGWWTRARRRKYERMRDAGKLHTWRAHSMIGWRLERAARILLLNGPWNEAKHQVELASHVLTGKRTMLLNLHVPGAELSFRAARGPFSWTTRWKTWEQGEHEFFDVRVELTDDSEFKKWVKSIERPRPATFQPSDCDSDEEFHRRHGAWLT